MDVKSIPLEDLRPPPDYEDTNHPHYPDRFIAAHSKGTKTRDKKKYILITMSIIAFILAFTVVLLAGIRYGLNHPRTPVPPGIISTTSSLITVNVTQQVTETVYPPGEDPIICVTATTFVTMARPRVVPSTTAVPFETPQPAKLASSPPPPPSSAASLTLAKLAPTPWKECPEPNKGNWDTKDDCHKHCRLELNQRCSLKDEK